MFSAIAKRALVYPSVLMVCGLLSWASLAVFFSDHTAAYRHELRSLKKERLKVAQSLRVLEDHRDLITLDESELHSRESVVLSILESVADFSAEFELPLNDIRIDESHSKSDDDLMVVMRLQVSVDVQHVTRLLSLFDYIKLAIGWLPMEIQGCTLERNTVAASLSTSCSIDVVVFPELMG